MTDMTEIQAKKKGAKARKEGRPNAPALNQKFIVATCESAVDTVKLLKAYLGSSQKTENKAR